MNNEGLDQLNERVNGHCIEALEGSYTPFDAFLSTYMYIICTFLRGVSIRE